MTNVRVTRAHTEGDQSFAQGDIITGMPNDKFATFKLVGLATEATLKEVEEAGDDAIAYTPAQPPAKSAPEGDADEG